ncbi:tape measure protein [Mycobacterium phage Achebe]|uniref:Tape measure protein n=1 Tax=Mycobacterium phage Backyardigan TaxID=2902881 RepID=G1BKZ8_9CAUD|nr:tail length tape measure protein [Mycobacterium phage Wile]YP_009635438.1 tail length tape measure protein [Mycobacterium phage Backyardigan]APD17374.1 tape measure protein [Mycobacterium phage Achebe]QAY06934.1 tape measure protein [Mycobacterium phage Datway]QCW22675.1 tape measure protein [Mycobacterium phage Xena]AEJ94512.1 tape measure protein [Mycobacterium phage Backyardigan]AEL19868.1 tape measure protein [Mycobacterium phage Wile]
MAGAGGTEVGRISIRVVPDLDGFYRELKSKLEGIEKTLKAKIKCEPDLKGFREEVASKTKGLKAKVKVDGDTNDLKRAIDAVNAKGLRKFKLELDPEFDYRLRQRLAKIKPKVDVDVDFKRGALDRLSRAMDKIQPPSFGSGINPAGWAVILAGVAAVTPLISGLLGAVTTAIVSLPGLITAVLVPIGALALGMDGLKAAAETIKGPFEDLKATMSSAVEEQFTPVFQKLKELFPSLESTLPGVTDGLRAMAQSFADSITSTENLPKVEGIIKDIGDALRQAAPGIGDFTSGLLDLVKGFTGKLPDVADWFNETGKSFKDWAKDFTEEGPDGTSKFSRALDGLGWTLKELGGGLVDIGGKALDFFSDPEKIRSFKTELDGLVATISTLVDLSNKLATNMSKIPGFRDGEANGPMDFAPIQLQLIKEQFDKIDWSGIWAGLKSTAAGAFAEVAMFAGNTAVTIGSKFRGIWDGIQTNAASAWNGVVSIVGGVIGNILAIAAQLPGQISSVWGSIPGIAAGIWNTVVSTAAPIITQILTTFLNVGMGIVNEVSSWPGKIVGALSGLASTLASVGSQAAQALVSALAAGIRAGMGPIGQAVGALMSAARAMIPNSPAKEGPFSGSGWRAVEGFGDALGDALASGIPDQEDKIVSKVRAIMQAIKDVFGDASKLNLNFNFGSLESGLSSVASAASDTSKALGNTVSGAMPNKLSDETKQQKDLLELKKDELEVERQKLMNQKNGLDPKDKAGRAALQQQIDQIALQKKQLELDKQQLDYAGKYTDQVEETDSVMGDMSKKIYDSVKGFATANANQFMNDLGISGQGALPQLLEQGIALGEHFIFNVSSMDEAITGQQTIQNKKALQFDRR